MGAIEDCYYWGAPDLADDLVDRHADTLHDSQAVGDVKFAEGVDRVIAKWRTGSAWAGSAYGSQAGEK